MMDAYAISGVRSEQIEFLSDTDYLSPTHSYGVTFERGVSIAYRDRKHVMISGTASIDRDGQIVHPGNVLRQLDRALENIEALLKQAGAGFMDACVFIVYVRNPGDLGIIQQVMSERFGQFPIQVVVAPVCRPGWLVELECQAIVADNNPTLPAF
jgi:enamine deaminase RidA (YjgF/YER057c/UK114 family)